MNRPRPLRGSLLVLLLQMVACSDGGTDETAGRFAGAPCRVAQPSRPLADEIPEASGAAVSRAYPGVIWTHNDSGGTTELFAIDATGRLIGTRRVDGAENVDWEDLSIGPCAGGDCIYIADIGDNEGQRTSIDIYRLAEPDPRAAGPVVADRFSMRYPDGPRDAEALFVLPPERVFVVTRGRGAPVAIYEYPGPLSGGTTVELRPVRTLTSGPVPRDDQVTAADASADGAWIALRTYTSILLYRTRALMSEGDPTPVRVSLDALTEVQGEGLAIGSNGALVLVGEGGAAGLAGSIAIVWCPALP
jgi:hypothetical protein